MATSIAPPQIDEIQMKGFDPKVTRRLIGFTMPYLGKLLLSLFLMFISSAAAVTSPFLVKVALDSGLEARSLPVLTRTVLLYLAVAAIQWLALFARINIMLRVAIDYL